jgi:pilus assembly protein CpaC
MKTSAMGFPRSRPVLRSAALRSACVLALSLAGLARSAVAAPPDAPEVATVEVSVHKGAMIRVSRPAATVFVADPSIADVESRSQQSIFVYGKKMGDTTLMVLDDKDRPLVNATVHVTHDQARLEELIRRVAPDADVTVTSVSGGVILEGSVEEPQEAEDIENVTQKFLGQGEMVLNRLAVTAPTQVNLRVRIAEVSKDVVRMLGVTWQAQDVTGRTQFNIATQPRTLANVTPNTAQIGQQIGPVSLEATIDALEGEGLVSLLAEPNLTAISGETASFLAGGEFPVPTASGLSNGGDSNLGSTVTVEFKSYGVSLAFTPTVLSGGRISLHLRPEVSELSSTGSVTINGFNIPGLVTRRADTTIELASGQSFMIGGLLQNNVTNTINKVPGLSDLPVLGKLFQSRAYQAGQTELVIIATPYLVKPVGGGRKLLAPTDRPMTDYQFERLLRNKLFAAKGSAPPADAADTKVAGPIGFMVE